MRTLLLLVSFAPLTACAGAVLADAGNPASQFCLGLGGRLESFQDRKGQGNNCVVEEWDLFRAMDQKKLVKPLQCDPGRGPCMPNPASVNCAQSGGTTRIVDTPQGQDGLCVIEEWALYRVFHK